MFSTDRTRGGDPSNGPSGSTTRKSRSSTPVRGGQRVGRSPTPSRFLQSAANGCDGGSGHGEPPSVAEAEMAKRLTRDESPVVSAGKRKAKVIASARVESERP
eukprot:10452277-Lingulodinium_polyedra.AAC.1